MTEVNVNGYHFTIQQRADHPSAAETEQLRLDFDKEHIFPGGVIRIKATKTGITITATAPLRPAA